MHMCMYVCMYVCTHVCMYARMYVHTYACVFMTYTDIDTEERADTLNKHKPQVVQYVKTLPPPSKGKRKEAPDAQGGAPPRSPARMCC